MFWLLERKHSRLEKCAHGGAGKLAKRKQSLSSTHPCSSDTFPVGPGGGKGVCDPVGEEHCVHSPLGQDTIPWLSPPQLHATGSQKPEELCARNVLPQAATLSARQKSPRTNGARGIRGKRTGESVTDGGGRQCFFALTVRDDYFYATLTLPSPFDMPKAGPCSADL